MYKINQVSRMTDLSQKRIRDYEKEGLIKPARDPNTNDRLFSEFDVKQIKRITHLIHERGFTIPGLKYLLAMSHCWNVFQCQETENCEAFKYPHKPCWEVLKGVDNTYFQEFCTTCSIYLSRKVKKIQLLEKPTVKV